MMDPEMEAKYQKMLSPLSERGLEPQTNAESVEEIVQEMLLIQEI